MNEGVGAVLAAVVSSIGTVLAVLIGARLLKGRVKDVESALESMKASIDAETLEMRGQFEELSKSMLSTMEKLNRIDASVEEENAETVQHNEKNSTSGDVRSEFAAEWRRVRDKIEQAAANPKIDGRTRAAYARRDRRQYWYLVEELAADGNLPGGKAKYHDALELWMSKKSGKAAISQNDVERLRQLANVIDHY